jgi:hypothetical protein
MAELYTALREAEALISRDELTRARDVVFSALNETGADAGVYSDAVSIFMLGRMYDDAERVHMQYKIQTGRDLRADFSLDEVRRERETSAPIMQDGAVIFRRLSLFQRGHFSNHFTLRPVTAVEVSDGRLVVLRGFQRFAFGWHDVKVTITRRKAAKGFGHVAMKFRQRLCTIETSQGRFRFDVSDQYPDFAMPRELIKQLARHTTIEYLGDADAQPAPAVE